MSGPPIPSIQTKGNIQYLFVVKAIGNVQVVDPPTKEAGVYCMINSLLKNYS